MAKKKAAAKRENQKDRSAPQLPGVEDNLSGALVTAMKEFRLAQAAVKAAEKRAKEAYDSVLARMQDDDLKAVRSECGEYVFEIEVDEVQKLKRRKIKKDERPEASTNQVA